MIWKACIYQSAHLPKDLEQMKLKLHGEVIENLTVSYLIKNNKGEFNHTNIKLIFLSNLRYNYFTLVYGRNFG